MSADVVVNLTEIMLMGRDPWVREDLLRRGVRVATIARAIAPHKSGAGAASIVAESVMTPGGWVCDIGWDKAHGYMRYTDLGTKYITAQHYLERALEQGV